MTIWFSSDIHFGHKNIIKYCNRPFSSVEEMNEALVANWNKLVSNDDIVYMLGDICMGSLEKSIRYVPRLNGQKHLIEGNHDEKAVKNPDFVRNFVWIKDYFELKYNKNLIIMMHYPILSWKKMHYGSVMLHGHCHGSLPRTDGIRRFDVGVDANNYKPISLDKILSIV